MVTFQKVPMQTLNTISGHYTGKPKPANVGIPTEELHRQVAQLVKQKVPLEAALDAVEKHPDIKNKEKAKEMVSAVYAILQPKQSQSKPSKSPRSSPE